MLKVTEVLGLDQTLRQRGHGGTHAAEGPGKHRETLPQVGKGETSAAVQNARHPARLLGAASRPAFLFCSEQTSRGWSGSSGLCGSVPVGLVGGVGGVVLRALLRRGVAQGALRLGRPLGAALVAQARTGVLEGNRQGGYWAAGAAPGLLATGRTQAVSTGGSGSEPPWLTANWSAHASRLFQTAACHPPSQPHLTGLPWGTGCTGQGRRRADCWDPLLGTDLPTGMSDLAYSSLARIM